MQVETAISGEKTVKTFSEEIDKIQQLRDMPIGEEHAFYVSPRKARSIVTMAGTLKYEDGEQLYTSKIDRSMAPVVYVKIWRTK